jgi:hypothetical protein
MGKSSGKETWKYAVVGVCGERCAVCGVQIVRFPPLRQGVRGGLKLKRQKAKEKYEN